MSGAGNRQAHRRSQTVATDSVTTAEAAAAYSCDQEIGYRKAFKTQDPGGFRDVFAAVWQWASLLRREKQAKGTTDTSASCTRCVVDGQRLQEKATSLLGEP